ncbi:hypothetical protein ACHAXT_002133 [Thalassiosira profunda]
MSLSFVKSAVLSSTDGVSHNEETTIDNQETKSLRAASGGTHKPLFEQLRANQEAAQEKDEEFQRSLRGMRPLDEEDCAHLDAVERAKGERERAAKSGIESEVALFRAAREDRGLVQTVVEEEGGEGGAAKDQAAGMEEARGNSGVAAKKEATKIVPKFTIKKKRKRTPQEGEKASDANKKGSGVNKEEDGKGEKKALPKAAANDSDSDNNEGGGLLGLACYGSDSD